MKYRAQLDPRVKDRGIRINAISPGSTDTPGLVDLAGPDPAQQQGLLGYLASTIPLGRVARPEEIAKAFCSWPQMMRASSTALSYS